VAQLTGDVKGFLLCCGGRQHLVDGSKEASAAGAAKASFVQVRLSGGV
jgi:hypothetical protein